MKIVLINPKSNHIVTAPPLGLLYIAAYVRKDHPDCTLSLIDAHLYHLNNEHIVKQIKTIQPDIVGLYTISANAPYAISLIQAIRPYTPTIVIGGPLVTSWQQLIMMRCEADFAIMGEGEIPFSNLIRYLKKYPHVSVPSINRVISRTSSKSIIYEPEKDVITDMNALPMPAWDMIDVESYFQASMNSESPVIGKKRVLPIFSSRGCPFKCSYCHNVFGKTFRARSAEHVVHEITYLKKTYGIEAIEIWDDVFNLDTKRLFRFCELMKAQSFSLNISFSNGLRGDILTKESVDALIEIGVKRINFGIESGTTRIQELLQKNQDLNKIKHIVAYIASKQKIITGGFFIIGNPTETLKEIQTTIRFANSLPLDLASFFSCTPNPGTDLFKRLPLNQQQNILQSPPMQYNYYEARFPISKVSPKTINKLLRKAYIRFYLNWKRIRSIQKKVCLKDMGRNGLFLLLYILRPKGRLFTRG